MADFYLYRGDITRLEIAAIVNAANRSLLGGGGVDGAIHRAAGPELLEECRSLNGCETGEAKMTKAYRLRADWIIHTVGPVWHEGTKQEEMLLRNCYLNSLGLAAEKKLSGIAFPNISTGIYRFPKKRAAEIALKSCVDFSKENKLPEKIIFAIFDEENFSIYTRLFQEQYPALKYQII